MENLHAPTVPSGPTSIGAANGVKTTGQTLAQLQAQKDNMEAELRALSGVLSSHGVDMNTRLLTSDGFPRSDIDVAQIRTTRARIIYLRNDYKTLMNAIEKVIHEHFATLASEASEATAESTAQSLDGTGTNPRPVTLDPPFAKVNTVQSGSPADAAGLKAGDRIRNFGYVDLSNHNNLSRVAQCVQGNEGQNVTVKVSRSAGSGGQMQELALTLTPRRNWGGPGLLGCHILPI